MATAVVALGAALVLIGWVTNTVALKSILPQLTPMNPVTATLFILSAAGLWMVLRLRPQWQRIAQGLGLLIFIVAALMLCYYAFKLDFKIDRIFFTSRLGINRMAFSTALGFLLTGAVLILLVWRQRRWAMWTIRGLAGLVLVIAGAAILSYLYGVVPVYGLSVYNPIAIHTGILFAVLSLAVINATRNDQEPLLDRRIILTFTLLLAAFIPPGVILYRSLHAIAVSNRQVDHTYQVIGSIADIRDNLISLETGQRGYLLTGKPEYLEPYTAAKGQMAGSLADLAELTHDNPVQQARLPQLNSLVGAKAHELEETINLRQTRGFQSAVAIVAANQGKQYTDAAQRILTDMESTERDLLAQRQTTSQRDLQLAYINLAFSTTFLFGLAALLYIFVHSAIRRRRQAEAELADDKAVIEAEKSRSEALLSSLGDGAIAIDTEWRITLFNRKAVELTGWSEAEALGQPFRDRVRLIRVRDRQEFVTFIAEAMLYGKAYNLTESVNIVRRDGTEIPIGDSAAPIFDKNGAIIGAVIVFRDVSEEQSMQQFKSDFAYASHQFRTPVSQAAGSLTIAMESPSLAEAKEEIKLAQVAVESISRMTTHLLAMSDLDQGRVKLKTTATDVGALAKKLMAAHKSDARARQVKLRATIAPDLPLIVTDGQLLKSVLNELLDNACLYSAPNTSSSLTLSQESGQLLLEITSHGPVISEEELPLIFTRFFRASNKPMDVPGSGLGLYISRGYASLLGGKLWFISTSDTTVFSLSLPIRKS